MNTTQLQALLELQKKDLTLIQLKKEAQGIPDRQQKLRDNAQGATRQAEAVKQQVRECEAKIKGIEVEVETARQQVTKYKNQQMQAKTNEEYKAFENEIATAGEKIGELEDRELEEMGRLDELKTQLVRSLELQKTAEAKAGEDVRDLESRLMIIRTTFEEIKAERGGLVDRIDPEIVERYLALLGKKQDAVVVPVRQQGCGGCHMKLTPQTLHDAHSQQKWTYCGFCGRLLYDPGEVG
ncbi:MAG: C4-type zinc ribbon domain-containing protein [Nitrospirales bacterium]